MNSGRILAVRLLKSLSLASKKQGASVYLEKMHRILKENTLYKFYSDIDITENRITITHSTPQELYNLNKSINISISAIVGENGSGKSTIIDYIIRVVNNLSAVLFGEYYYSISSEHLHYIKDVYAELYVLVDNIVFRISCEGEKITVDSYNFNNAESKKDIAVFDNKESKSYTIDYNKPCKKNSERSELLSKFCYTMIVNYSLYSFETSTYKEELTAEEKEIQINKQGLEDKYTSKNYVEIKERSETTKNDKECIEARSWLTGLMWKRDGYQVPLLITPFRQKGQVDQRKEYVNGKDRLLSLALLRNNNGRTFTQINNKETVDFVTLKLDSKYMNRTYLSIFDDLLPNFSESVRLALFNLVKNILINKYHIPSNGTNATVAWYYVVYKFFKIVLTYPGSAEHRRSLHSITNRINTKIISEIKKLVEDICNIHSHVTILFWRSIFYLKYNLPGIIAQNTDSKDLAEEGISLEEYSEKAYFLQSDTSSFVKNVDELLPPPFFNIDFKLYSVDDNEKKNAISFESLSSGEKQITLSLSTIFYFLSNLGFSNDSENNVIEKNKTSELSIINYRHACVILDELELYFHPEMQRTFIIRLLSGLKQIHLGNIKSIHFLMATHSPFILSDIPRSNVLFLNKNGKPEDIESMHTFGANIHTMLEHSFFLKDGTIGAFAKRIIGEIEVCLNIYKLYCPSNNKQERTEKEKFIVIKEKYEGIQDFLDAFFDDNTFNFNDFSETYSKERIRATIDLFDEPIIKKVLLNDYFEVFPQDKKEDKKRLIDRCKRQLSSLNKVLKENPNDEAIKDLISELNNKIKSLKNEK